MRKLMPGLLVLAAAAAFTVWAYPQLPPLVATHFDLHGRPNGWSSRFAAAVLIPAIVVGLAVVFAVLPKIDPRKANYAKFGPAYWTIANAVLVVVAAIHVVTLMRALGWDMNLTRVAFAGVGALMVLVGNLMTRLRPNWFVGIRTPWTLSSETVWRKTHRFGGYAFIVAGLCLMASGFVATRWGLMVGLGAMGAAALASVVYSYLLWRGEQEDGPPPQG